MAMYAIGGQAFRSKQRVVEYVRSVIAGYRDDEPFSGGDMVFVLALVDRHPKAQEKIGAGVRSVVARNNGHGSRGMWLRRADGSEVDFSFYKCLYPVTHEREVKRALREEVCGQVQAFKRRFFRGSDCPECPLTGEVMPWDNAHVDHVPPDTFERLVRQFLGVEGLSFDDVGVTTPPTQLEVVLADRDLALRWADFHAEHARLRVVSVWGNLSVARRGA